MWPLEACVLQVNVTLLYHPQRGTQSLSRTLKLLIVLSWWNDLPNSVRASESLAIFKNWLKTHLFLLYLTL